jgi:hypothetical protein
MAKRSREIEVEIREDISSTPDYPMWKAIVTTPRGRCFFAVYAYDRPSDDKVRNDWLADKGTSRAKNWTPCLA